MEELSQECQHVSDGATTMKSMYNLVWLTQITLEFCPYWPVYSIDNYYFLHSKSCQIQ